MTSIPSGSTQMGQTGRIDTNLANEKDERGMLQASRRVRTQRTTDSLPGVGDDRPVRHDLVRQIRAQILSGEYETTAKIEAAADRLSGSLDLLA